MFDAYSFLLQVSGMDELHFQPSIDLIAIKATNKLDFFFLMNVNIQTEPLEEFEPIYDSLNFENLHSILKLIKASWYEQHTMKLVAQFCSNLETNHHEVSGVLQMIRHEIPNWHYPSVDNPGMHFLAFIKLKQ